MADWQPTFPHREIDSLIERLQTGQSQDQVDAFLLLSLVAKEAQRLRATVARLTAAKLAAADKEAREIVTSAQGHADAIRAASLAALNDRLNEADHVLSAVRAALKVESRAAHLARAEVEAPMQAGDVAP